MLERLPRTAFQLVRQRRIHANIPWLSRSTQIVLKQIRQRSTETNGNQDGERRLMKWDQDEMSEPSSSIRVLETIARKPQSATRIRTLDLQYEHYGRMTDLNSPNIAPLASLFEQSPVLREARLIPSAFSDELQRQRTAKDQQNDGTLDSVDWESTADRGPAPQYSQNATAFLITHLPWVKQLRLPDRWRPSETSDRLIAAAVRLAHRDPSGPGLGQLEWISVRVLTSDIQFLALPNLRTFNVVESIWSRQRRYQPLPLPTNLTFGRALESISLWETRLGHESVDNILCHAPNLRRFYYVFGWVPEKEEDLVEDEIPDNLRLSDDKIRPGIDDPWDICKLVQTLQRRNGHSLTELHIMLQDDIFPTVPGTADFRGFHKLGKLEISLEFFVCQLQTNGPRSLVDFLPPSLTTLTIQTTGGTEAHLRAVRGLFHQFKELRPQHLPLLKDVTLQCWDGIRDEPVGRQYDEILDECADRSRGLDVGVYWEEFDCYS